MLVAPVGSGFLAGGVIVRVDSTERPLEGVVANGSRGNVHRQSSTDSVVQRVPRGSRRPALLSGVALATIRLVVPVDGLKLLDVGPVQVDQRASGTNGSGGLGGKKLDLILAGVDSVVSDGEGGCRLQETGNRREPEECAGQHFPLTNEC